MVCDCQSDVRPQPEMLGPGGNVMFKRDHDSAGSSAASSLRIGEKQPVRSKNVSVIGPTLVFKGELSADEDLVISSAAG